MAKATKKKTNKQASELFHKIIAASVAGNPKPLKRKNNRVTGFKNPTKASKANYKEKLQHGQGIDLEPKSNFEIKSQKSNNEIANQFDEEARLNGGRNTQFNKDGNQLGSLPEYDGMDDEDAS